MEAQSIDIEKLLVQQLKSLGIEVGVIPYVIRDINFSFVKDPFMDFTQVNNNLISLGWDDVNFDYRTYVLAREYFEMIELGSYKNRDIR